MNFLFAIIFSFVLIGVNKVSIGYRITNSTNSITKQQLCLSEGCIETSYQLFKSMNRSVDPCQDFNKFVCGRFMKEAIIPDKQQQIDLTTTQLKHVMYDRGQKLMETESDDIEEFEIDQKVKAFYATCTDSAKREEAGIKPILDILESIGGWPVLNSNVTTTTNDTMKNTTSYKWYEQIPKVFKVKMGSPMWLPIMAVGVTIDTVNNREKHSLGIDQPQFYPATQTMLSYGITYPTVKIYHQYAVDSAIFLGANKDVAEKDMKDVMDFEILLARASTKETARNATLVNSTTVKDLPNFPCGNYCSDGEIPSWEKLFTNIFQASGNNITITSNDSVIQLNPPFFEAIIPILNQTDPRTIANYIGWRMVAASLNHLNEKAREMFREVTTPIGTMKQVCLNTMGFNNYKHGLLHGAVGSMYARKYFDTKEKIPITQIFQYLRKSFHEMLEETTWMGDETKQMAKTKLKSMKQNIAYPNEMLNQTIMDEYHQDMILDKNNTYFDNLREVVKISVKHNLGKLRESVDPDSWEEHQVVVVPNAYYVPLMNEMRFPAGFLQGIYYNSQRPQYLNFGGIGSLVGHEMTHGFDRQGRNFDEEGNKVDWWTSKEDVEFQKRGNCLVKQYNNFTVEQLIPYLKKFNLTANPEIAELLNVNGKLTLDENIADNGGIKEAYYAYLKWVGDNQGNLQGKGQKEEQRLPGFEEFTPRQMFWVSYAQMYCSKWTDNGVFKLLTEDTHTPGGYRTHGVVMNSKEFAEDFKCSEKSPMNPAKKCEVWASPISKSKDIIKLELIPESEKKDEIIY